DTDAYIIVVDADSGKTVWKTPRDVINEREWTFFRTRRASRNGVLAVKLGGSGDVTNTHVLWRFEKSLPDVPAPLVYKDVVFLVRSGGIATTLDAQTGKVLKQARLTGALEDYYASPIGVDGKVYIASEHDKVVVLPDSGGLKFGDRLQRLSRIMEEPSQPCG